MVQCSGAQHACSSEQHLLEAPGSAPPPTPTTPHPTPHTPPPPAPPTWVPPTPTPPPTHHPPTHPHPRHTTSVRVHYRRPPSCLLQVGGPGFAADPIAASIQEAGHRTETEVLAPLRRWQEVHQQLGVSPPASFQPSRRTGGPPCARPWGSASCAVQLCRPATASSPSRASARCRGCNLPACPPARLPACPPVAGALQRAGASEAGGGLAPQGGG